MPQRAMILRIPAVPGIRVWAILVAGLLTAMVLFFLPQPARANVDCAAGAARLDFGAVLTGTGAVTFTCNNYGTSARTMTLCLGIDGPSYPGSAAQPQLLANTPGGARTLNFNVYKDAGGGTVWTNNNPSTLTITIPANSTYNGNFTYYGRIPSGQTIYAGYTYQAYFYQTTLGYIASGNPVCQSSLNDMNGRVLTMYVTANPIETCILGTSDAVDFGSHSRIGDNLDAAGTVRVDCPPNVNWTLHFDGGQNALGAQRRMRNEHGSYIPYLLYRDAGHGQQIAIDGTIPGTGTGQLAQIPIYGRVQPRQPPEIGEYADTVVVILSF